MPQDPDQGYDVHRALEAFNLDDARLAFELSLDHIDVKILRELVHHDPEKPMVFCYELNQTQANLLAGMLGITADFERYSYFIGCSAKDSC